MPEAYNENIALPLETVQHTIDLLTKTLKNIAMNQETIETLVKDKKQLEELIKVSEIAERVTQIEGISDTAASEDKSVIEWVTDVLADAVLVKQKAAIYVEPEIVDQFAEIATARGVAVAHITQSKKTTKYIETGFKNYVY